MLRDLLRGCYHTLRETLPDDTHEAGIWLSGMVWAFCLHWAMLIFVTWSVCTARGGC